MSGFAVYLGYIREPPIELLQLNVEIADGAKRVGDPSEIVAKVVRRRREQVANSEGPPVGGGSLRACHATPRCHRQVACPVPSHAGRRTGGGAQPAPGHRSGPPPRLK